MIHRSGQFKDRASRASSSGPGPAAGLSIRRAGEDATDMLLPTGPMAWQRLPALLTSAGCFLPSAVPAPG
jgi:hypothetical protein